MRGSCRSGSWWLGVLSAGGLLAATPPALAYDWTYGCLDIPTDQGFALRLAVGGDGELHLARLQRAAGNLHYTRVSPDGTTVSQQVAPGISNFGANEVSGLDLELFGGLPHLCFYDVRQDRVSVAIGPAQPGGAFTTEVIFAGPGARDDCALFTVGGQVGVAFNTTAGLQVAMRVAPGQWVIEPVDAGRNGHDVDAATLETGEVVLAHRDEPGWELRLSVRGLDGAWRTQQVPRFGLEWAQTPSIVPGVQGAFLVFHGLRPDTSDIGLVRTTVSDAGVVASQIISGPDAVGGSLSAGHFVEGVAVLSRQLRRSALFGASDGLQFYDEMGRDTLASHSSAQQRHRYQFVNARRDPFGLPVLAVYDDQSPFAGLQGGAFVCLWRPTDTDFDRIPDSEEDRLGTLPAVADTDGDGVTDGIEYLVDRTDPRGPGDLPDSDAGVLPDVGVGLDAFVPPLDLGPLPDQGPTPDHGPVADAAQPDQNLPPRDQAPGPDAAADRGALDANPSDGGTDAAPTEDVGIDPDGGMEADRGADDDMGPSSDGAVRDSSPPRDARTPPSDGGPAFDLSVRGDFGTLDARVRPGDSEPSAGRAPEASGCAVGPESASDTGGGPLAWALMLVGALARRRRART